MFLFEKGKLRGENVTASFRNQKGCPSDEDEGHFSFLPKCKIHTNEFKLQEGKFKTKPHTILAVKAIW